MPLFKGSNPKILVSYNRPEDWLSTSKGIIFFQLTLKVCQS